MDGMMFDLDGTLWDSTEEVTKAWNKAIKNETPYNHQVTQPQLKALFGKPLDEIIKDIFWDLSLEKRQEVEEILFRYENEWVAKAPCYKYEGMQEGIPKLAKRFPLFIVSNCQKGYIEAFLENTGLGPYITDYTCPGDTGMLKADNIRLIMERNHLEKIAYVGDTQGDADACEKAGVPIVYATYGFGEVENPWRTIASFDELLDMEFDLV